MVKLKTNRPFMGEEWEGYSLRDLLSQVPMGQYQFWHQDKYTQGEWRFVGFIQKGSTYIEYSPESI